MFPWFIFSFCGFSEESALRHVKRSFRRLLTPPLAGIGSGRAFVGVVSAVAIEAKGGVVEAVRGMGGLRVFVEISHVAHGEGEGLNDHAERSDWRVSLDTPSPP